MWFTKHWKEIYVMKQSIGNFLLRRLEAAGMRHIFGVPGDYNLELMRQLEDRGQPARIGNRNELNTSYPPSQFTPNKPAGECLLFRIAFFRIACACGWFCAISFSATWSTQAQLDPEP